MMTLSTLIPRHAGVEAQLDPRIKITVLPRNEFRALLAERQALREALEQWFKGEDHADKGELAEAAAHYAEAVKLTVAALALAHKEVQ